MMDDRGDKQAVYRWFLIFSAGEGGAENLVQRSLFKGGSTLFHQRTRLVTCGRFDSHTSPARRHKVGCNRAKVGCQLLTPPWESSMHCGHQQLHFAAETFHPSVDQAAGGIS